MENDLASFFFDLPIYTTMKIDEDSEDFFLEICSSRHAYDFTGYNPREQLESTFQVDTDLLLDGDKGRYFVNGGIGKIQIICKRTGCVFYFFVNWDPDTREMMKVGQYPSVADFHISEVKQYCKVLSKEKLREFTKAIGLAANGVGIGSFVYLRRIFEYLIDVAYTEALSENTIVEKNYQVRRMDERIVLLKEYLPDFLVENRSIYSILSVGIHELSEDTCLEHFDALRVGIEIILDEKLERKKKANKIEEAKKRLAEVNRRMK